MSFYYFLRFSITFLYFWILYDIIQAVFYLIGDENMTPILYQFEKIYAKKQNNYIFQLVKNRKLTDIYHSHDFYELICFLDGKGIQLINGIKWICEKNSITFIRPNDTHCFVEHSEDIAVLSLSIRKEEFEMIAQLYSPLLLCFIQRQEKPVYSASNLPFLYTYINKNAHSITEYDCKFILSCFLKMYIDTTGCLQINLELPYTLTYALNEMKKKENLQQGIPALVELSHYSQSHLSRLIKKYFNMSLKEYINEMRLQIAYSDIVFSQKTLESISEDIGFCSFSHFNKIFKAKYSITPSRLRKNNGIWTT